MARGPTGRWSVVALWATLVLLAACGRQVTGSGPAVAIESPTPAPAGSTSPSPIPSPSPSPNPIAPSPTGRPSPPPSGNATPPVTSPVIPLASPTPPGSPVPPPAGVALVIAQADNGRTFTLPVGSVVELRLGGGLRWSTPSSASGPLSVAPVSLAADAGYQAWRIVAANHGTLVIESSGGMACQPNQMCAQFLLLFRVTIVVP